MGHKFAEQSDKEGWPAARFLAALAEHEIADRGSRRIERHLAEARLPVGKTLGSFEFTAVPLVSKAQVMALTSGDSWLDKGAKLLLFGPPGGCKPSRARARRERMARAVLDDTVYVSKDQAETNVLFELIGSRSPPISRSANGARCFQTKLRHWQPSTASPSRHLD